MLATGVFLLGVLFVFCSASRGSSFGILVGAMILTLSLSLVH